MSYLGDVKQQLEDVFFESFDKAWQEVVEPAIKQSYQNGVEAGRRGVPAETAEAKPRRQWGRRQRGSGESDG